MGVVNSLHEMGAADALSNLETHKVGKSFRPGFSPEKSAAGWA
jgi:hypothetical protein